MPANRARHHHAGRVAPPGAPVASLERRSPDWLQRLILCALLTGIASSAVPVVAAPLRPVALVVERVIGKSGTGPGEFLRPGGLAVTPVGGVLVADTGNTRVQHLDLEGELLWEVGGLGTEEGALRRPTAVAAATSLTYLVLDSLGRQVLEFHARGEFLGVGLRLHDAALSDRFGDIEPRGLAVDRSGNTILSDREGDRLLVFAPTWDLLYEIGGFGDDAQSFADPEGLAVGPDRIYVADSMNGRIQVLDALGGFLHAWALPGGGMPVDVALDPHGNLFIADAAEDRIVVLGPEGHPACVAGENGRAPGQFRRPDGLCVVGDRLVVADADNDRLQVMRILYESDEP